MARINKDAFEAKAPRGEGLEWLAAWAKEALNREGERGEADQHGRDRENRLVEVTHAPLTVLRRQSRSEEQGDGHENVQKEQKSAADRWPLFHGDKQHDQVGEEQEGREQEHGKPPGQGDRGLGILEVAHKPGNAYPRSAEDEVQRCADAPTDQRHGGDSSGIAGRQRRVQVFAHKHTHVDAVPEDNLGPPRFRAAKNVRWSKQHVATCKHQRQPSPKVGKRESGMLHTGIITGRRRRGVIEKDGGNIERINDRSN